MPIFGLFVSRTAAASAAAAASAYTQRKSQVTTIRPSTFPSARDDYFCVFFLLLVVFRFIFDLFRMFRTMRHGRQRKTEPHDLHLMNHLICCNRNRKSKEIEMEMEFFFLLFLEIIRAQLRVTPPKASDFLGLKKCNKCAGLRLCRGLCKCKRIVSPGAA